MAERALLDCRFCGQSHSPAPLPRGGRWVCNSCGLTLAQRSWLGRSAPAAFAAAAGILAIPALLLPFATVSKLGAPRVTEVFSGVVALWEHRLPILSGWVAVCGLIGPVVLALTIVVAAFHAARGSPAGKALSGRFAHALEAWAMPEVHVLAVLVSFVRIETLADVTVGPGFWCYAAMAITLMLASRGFRLEPELAS